MITQAATGQATLIWIEPVLSSYPISGQNSEYEYSHLKQEEEMNMYI
jgi:predicted P-loop ATPase/GTPase